MNKKITRWSLMNILFAILVSIPLWSIIVRTGYVLLNKNAYQSYYGQTINEVQTEVVNYNDLKINSYYEVAVLTNTEDSVTATSWYTLNVKVNGTEYDDVSALRIYKTNILYIVGLVNGTQTYYWTSANIIYFTFNGYIDIQQGNAQDYATFTLQTYNSYSYLDNVFDYSIDKFNSENDAHYDFVSNVANIFITEDSYGWRYVEFVNWYFNYFIVISAVYILFLCIIWFISICRRLIERSMNLW